MEWIGLQEFQKPVSAKWAKISRMHFGYVPKNIQNGKIYLYTITEKVLSAKIKQHQYDTYCMMYGENSKKSIFFLDFAMKCRII